MLGKEEVASCSLITSTPIRDHVKQSSPDLIQSICSQTQNPAYCQQLLQPLYRPGESLRDLGQSAFFSVSKLVFFTYDEIHVREVKTVTDPVLNKIYHKCGALYTAAINALDKAKGFLKSGDFQKLPNLVSLALNQPALCDSSFTPPTVEPADFKNLNNEARDACSVILAISNRLVSGKKNL
ncbi:hypothetical protein Sango_2114100 [Sesamum angolense]|uniref:Pectinesterase inhibitor domain-containing protein n=1 Tax=Sesamum angolense TaxID=2727404 RepID=A0AAE1WBT7_9LAMI|nr:hypothetical protein Sango_2114100 [Sesamum angolense]